MRKAFLFALVLTAAFTYSCKKDKKQGCMDPNSIAYDSQAEEDNSSCVYGGTGGNVTVVAKPQHHGVSIRNKFGYADSASVKFNTVNAPSGSYDLVIAGEEPDSVTTGEDHVHIPGLKPGRYYIYMSGWDSTISQRVYGGIHFDIPLTKTDGELEVLVPVTE